MPTKAWVRFLFWSRDRARTWGTLALLYATFYLTRVSSRGTIHAPHDDVGAASAESRSGRTAALVERCRSVFTSRYYPNPVFAASGLLHSVLAEFLRPPATGLYFEREFLATADGGTLLLSWAGLEDAPRCEDPSTPVLMVLPGVNGDEHGSWYIHTVIKQAIVQYKYRVVVYVRRGCAIPMTNGRPQDYADASKTEGGDMQLCVDTIRRRYPDAPLLGIGYSLGGNFLTNYLGERSLESSAFIAGCAVGSPMDVTGVSYWVEHRYRMVDWFLRRTKSKIVDEFRSVIEGDHEIASRGISVDAIMQAKSFREQCAVDNLRVWGETGETLNQYLDRSSCINTVGRVKVPHLMICALDDPVSHALFIPYSVIAENPNVVLLTTLAGGHHAYCNFFPNSLPWCDEVALKWLNECLLLHRGEMTMKSV